MIKKWKIQSDMDKMMTTATFRPTSLYSRVVLAGMMGTGKSTVARLLANYLDWDYIDTDAEIETRCGQTINQIFAQQGEVHFRKLEKQFVCELADRKNCIIATGGGMVVPEENRNLLIQDSLVVHLHTNVEQLVIRLQHNTDRPLLQTSDLQNRLHNLYQERAFVYEGLPLQIQTDDKTPEQVAQEILFFLLTGSKNLVSRHSQVHVGLNLLSQIDDCLQKSKISSPLFVLADASVWQQFGKIWLQQLEQATTNRTKIIVISLPSHEKTKSMATVVKLWEKLIAAGGERSSGFLVLGGGVLGDVGGFVASTFMRGIPLIQVPTTLLAQTDSALGGKTGINLKQTKNMVGTFYPAQHVLIDPLLLLTLPEREIRSGLAEMIKAALILDADFFAFLEENLQAIIERRLRFMLPAIAWSAQLKLNIVNEDPYEQSGKRLLLNFGHTFGHAYEAISRYELRHGEAVALGMILATRLAVRLGKCSPQVLQKLIALLRQAQLPTELPNFSHKTILAKIKRDKKRARRQLQFVIPLAVGQAEVISIQKENKLLLAFD